MGSRVSPPRRAPWSAPPEWQDTFAAVPRAQFLPPLIWPHDQASNGFTPLDQESDPLAWQAAADADVPVVTQWDDGAHRGTAPGNDSTSSASMPSLVATMLAALDLRPGMRVLEVGTGTGWTAALLSHRLGSENVTTVEVDPHVAGRAEAALYRAGHRPRVVTGDGALGVPDAAPFDRIIVTCGMRQIPAAWIKQVRPGGSILVPWGTPFNNQRDALARLTVRRDGSARGPLLQLVSFMRMRAQRTELPACPDDLAMEDSVSTYAPPADPWHPFAFLAGLRMRDVAYAVQPHDDGCTQWLYDLAGPGWTAAVRRGSTGPGIIVRRAGNRRLWDELRAVHEWWQAAGSPGVERFGLNVGPDGRTAAWLDDPLRPLRAA